MESATGRWVSGNDFFDRESELQVLDARVRAGNHTLLTGQRLRQTQPFCPPRH